MDAELKAKGLIERFEKEADDYGVMATTSLAIACAIICVDEILEAVPEMFQGFYNDDYSFWKQVKHHLGQL